MEEIFYKGLSKNNDSVINEDDITEDNKNKPENEGDTSQHHFNNNASSLQLLLKELSKANALLNEITKEPIKIKDNNTLLQRIRRISKGIEFKLWFTFREAEKNAMHNCHPETNSIVYTISEEEQRLRNALIEWGRNTSSCVAVTLNTNMSEEKYSLRSLKKKLGRCISTYRNLSLGAQRGKVEFFGSIEGLDSKPHFHLVLISPVFEDAPDLSLIYKEENKLTKAWQAIFPGGSVFMEKITDSDTWIKYIFKYKKSLSENLIIDEETAESSFLKNNNSSATFKPIRVLSNDPYD